MNLSLSITPYLDFWFPLLIWTFLQTPDRGGRQEDGLQSRLARLAGQQPGNNDRDDSNPRSLMDMDRFDGPPQDRGKLIFC